MKHDIKCEHVSFQAIWGKTNSAKYEYRRLNSILNKRKKANEQARYNQKNSQTDKKN